MIFRLSRALCVFLFLLFTTNGAAADEGDELPRGNGPDASGAAIGLEKLTVTDAFSASGAPTLETETDFVVLRIGFVENSNPWYFKLDVGLGYSSSGEGVPNAALGAVDMEDALLMRGGVKLGYNVHLGKRFRVRPTVGYKGEIRRNSVRIPARRGDVAGSDGTTETTVDYTWHGLTYGVEADLRLGNVTLFAGMDVFQGEPDISGAGSLPGGEPRVEGRKDHGTEFHLGAITQIGRTVLFVRGYQRNWSADMSFGGSRGEWDAKQTGIVAGFGYGF